MSTPSWDGYIRFRVRAMERLAALTGGTLVQEPDLVALVSPEHGSRGGLLLTGPVPEQRIDEVLRHGSPQWVALLPGAQSLADAVAARGWDQQDERITMATHDLASVPRPSLPEGVELHQVAVRQGAEGFPLEAAVRLYTLYDEPTPAALRDLEIEAQLVRRLSGISLFAAVTVDGSCVGTAGSRVVDGDAWIAAVATAPHARDRGIGTAMTATALHAAARDGARQAYLDATAIAISIYRRLGLSQIGPVRWCERSLG